MSFETFKQQCVKGLFLVMAWNSFPHSQKLVWFAISIMIIIFIKKYCHPSPCNHPALLAKLIPCLVQRCFKEIKTEMFSTGHSIPETQLQSVKILNKSFSWAIQNEILGNIVHFVNRNTFLLTVHFSISLVNL